MAYSYITTGATVQVSTGAARKVIVMVNAALTGSIKVIDGTAGTTANVATITNPTVGSYFEYWDFQNGCRIVTSTTCDVTVAVDGSHGPK
jgi:hypothetical protein